MPSDNDLIALKGYTPPDPTPDYELKAGEVTKVKDRVRTLLAAGPMVKKDLVHLTCHEGRAIDGVAKLTAKHVKVILADMADADEFEAGYRALTATAEPMGIG